jgi:hypothetical protein
MPAMRDFCMINAGVGLKTFGGEDYPSDRPRHHNQPTDMHFFSLPAIERISAQAGTGHQWSSRVRNNPYGQSISESVRNLNEGR